MRVIDSHVHFWQPERLRYSWLDALEGLKRPFLPADYEQATVGVEIEGIVFVQADCLPEQGLAEVDWVAGLAAPVRAIVGFAPLEQGAGVESYLAQLKQRPLLKGVRRLIQSEAAAFATQPDFVRGVQRLAAYDLPFDICVRPHQLTAVIELVQQCPEVSFVLDHIGKPDIKSGAFADWQQHLQTLAAFPHVWCKLSGVITEADWTGWTVKGIRPYVDQVLEVFGPERVMFGSDWPVVNLAGSFGAWFEALLSCIDGLSAAEKQKLLRENAIRFYGIDDNE